VAWCSFYAVTYGATRLVSGMTFDDEPPKWLMVLYSSRVYDLLRFAAIIGVNAAIFLRVGYYLERISGQRNDG
jgi:hypothetical protein